MQKFYNISTTDFRPISFESVYLYGEYKKIKNFLLSNNKQELLKVLAIPSYKNNNIVWSANTNNEIKKLDQYSKTQQNKILSEYNEFLNSYNNFVKNLRSSKNQDNKNWGELLFSLIEGTANELFFDGENIFITWGWRLIDENSKKLIPVYSPPPSIVEDMTPIIEEEIEEQEGIPIIEEPEEVPLEEEKLSWLDRFYLFLKKLWWLIPMLSFIILIMLLFRSCENQACIDLNNKINNIDTLLDNCDCKEVVVRGCIDKNYKEYNPDANVDDGSCRTKLVPCNNKTESGGYEVSEEFYALGSTPGKVIISYDMKSQPDKMEVYYNGKKVTSTYEIRGNRNGMVGDEYGSRLCCGSLCFNYDPEFGDRFCKIVVTGGSSGTVWNYTLQCPTSGSCR